MSRQKVVDAISALAAVVNDDSITLPLPGDRTAIYVVIGMLDEVVEAYDES